MDRLGRARPAADDRAVAQKARFVAHERLPQRLAQQQRLEAGAIDVQVRRLHRTRFHQQSGDAALVAAHLAHRVIHDLHAQVHRIHLQELHKSLILKVIRQVAVHDRPAIAAAQEDLVGRHHRVQHAGAVHVVRAVLRDVP